MAEQVKTRRQLQGVVVSDKMDKTITVEVRTYKTHPIYGKRGLPLLEKLGKDKHVESL